MKQPIVITGASGFVGSHLIPSLQKENIPLVLLSHKKDLFFDCTGIEVIPVPEDCNGMIELFQTKRPAGVIHLATCFAPAHTPELISDMIRSNIELGTNLAEASVSTETKWFLNIGTFWQHYEGATYDPVNLYAATKQALEDIFVYYRHISDTRFVTLCLNDTFGPGDTRKKIFPLWKELSENPEKAMQMSPGDQIIDVLYIDDVISGICHLKRMLEEDNPAVLDQKIFYLSAKKRYTLRETAEIFEKILGRKLNIEWGARPYRKREVMNPECAGILLPGWENKYSLDEGIACFLNGDSK